MRRRILGWTCGVAALLAAALAVGCGRDASGPEGGGPLAASAAPLAEGARVRATVRDEVVPGEGVAAVRDLGAAVAEAVLENGRAVDERTGAVLAALPGASASRELRHTDDAAHEHRLVLEGAAGGGPVASVRYERDGEVVAVAAYRWDARDGGFVLRDRVLTLLRDGRVVLRQVREAGATVVVRGAPPVAAAAAGGGRPRVLRMQVDEIRCLKEWALYAGASATLILAGEVYLVAPSPATAGALLSAAGAWEKALHALLLCQAAGVTSL